MFFDSYNLLCSLSANLLRLPCNSWLRWLGYFFTFVGGNYIDLTLGSSYNILYFLNLKKRQTPSPYPLNNSSFPLPLMHFLRLNAFFMHIYVFSVDFRAFIHCFNAILILNQPSALEKKNTN